MTLNLNKFVNEGILILGISSFFDKMHIINLHFLAFMV